MNYDKNDLIYDAIGKISMEINNFSSLNII
jgi:hypothetical protein